MFFSTLALPLCAIGTAAASVLPHRIRSDYAVKEQHPVPFNWVESGPAPRDHTIHLQIGLKQSNEDLIEKHLLEISDPKNSRWRQHLSAAEISDMIRPSDETLELVKSWLEDHDIRQYWHNPSKDWIHLVVPIEKAEEMLQTKYSTYVHEDGSSLSRTPEWSLPLHLHPHIDVVQPTNSFFRPTPKASMPLLDDGATVNQWWQQTGAASYSEDAQAAASADISTLCNVSFTTPRCKRALYGTLDYKPQATDQNSIGFCNYLNETAKRTDVAKAMRNFRPAAASYAKKFEIEIIDNGNNDQGPYTAEQLDAGKNIEGNLDAENILSVVYPTPMKAWNTGGSPPFIPDIRTPTDTNEPYNVWLNYVLAQDSIPQVISTSYGDNEQTVPESYAKRACQGFAQLGARGVSVFFSSGDSGVGEDKTCKSNVDGKRMFTPAFPAGCPWVTTVGGTEQFEPEVAVTRYASGGGFANYFKAPAYQRDTVAAYIESLGGQYDGLYNKEGRGYPDVAAQGNHDAIVWAGNITTVGGTSASSPTFAAVISLVNDALLAAGKPSLGFLNPWIYSGAYSTLTDVVTGSSYGCSTDGFPAQAGWDAVTGWGTPNFDKLVEAAMAK